MNSEPFVIERTEITKTITNIKVYSILSDLTYIGATSEEFLQQKII